MKDIEKYTEIICENPWISLKRIVKQDDGIEGYVFSHESRCDGKIVAILPYRINENHELEYLIRNEVTPCWGFQHEYSSITGGVERNDPGYTVIEEIKQEAGYDITTDDIIPLGTSYASKSSDTIYYLFAVDLSGKEKVYEGDGDGSHLEKIAYCEWLPPQVIAISKDPQLYVLEKRLGNEMTRRECAYEG